MPKTAENATHHFHYSVNRFQRLRKLVHIFSLFNSFRRIDVNLLYDQTTHLPVILKKYENHFIGFISDVSHRNILLFHNVH